MPAGSKNVKKVSETNFPTIKQYIVDNGVEPAQTEFGYSSRTIRLIKNSEDYTVFRAKRQARQAKSRVSEPGPQQSRVRTTDSSQFEIPNQELKSVVPPQSVTTPAIKKPGHGRAGQSNPVAPAQPYQPGTFVTREKHDQDLRNQAAATNRALAEVGKLGKELHAITKEDAAYREADILLADKAKKPWWQRLTDGIREGFRS